MHQTGSFSMPDKRISGTFLGAGDAAYQLRRGLLDCTVQAKSDIYNCLVRFCCHLIMKISTCTYTSLLGTYFSQEREPVPIESREVNHRSLMQTFGVPFLTTTMEARRSQHSQECRDPARQYFCRCMRLSVCPMTAKNSKPRKTAFFASMTVYHPEYWFLKNTPVFFFSGVSISWAGSIKREPFGIIGVGSFLTNHCGWSRHKNAEREWWEGSKNVFYRWSAVTYHRPI